MNTSEIESQTQRHRRIRRVKRWLRHLPRRTNIHRYPVLRWFSRVARRRSYLWSFRVEQAVPALYLGCVLTLLPLFGIQIILACLLALLFKANLPLLAGIQMISNPFTVLPIWFILYQKGRGLLSVLGVEAPALGWTEIRTMLENVYSGNWGANVPQVATVLGIITISAIIVGVFLGFVTSSIYRYIAYRTSAPFVQLKQQLKRR